MTCNIYTYEQQSNIAYELFNSVTKSIKHVITSYREELLLKEIEATTFILLSNIYSTTADIQSFRDMLDGYYINDTQIDEKVLTSFFYYLEDNKEHIENILDEEKFKSLPKFMSEKLSDALEKLYAQLVNASFDLSLKIGDAYIGSESNYNLLQEA